MLFHLRTNVHTWRSEWCQNLDRVLEEEGSRCVDVDWERIQTLVRDSDHLTERGFLSFSEQLAQILPPLLSGRTSRLLIVSDSTIGHNDRAGKATRDLKRRFRARGIRVHVDSVCGSGFVAMAREGHHFRARLSSRQAGLPGTAVLFVGGWNDVTSGHPEPRLHAAVRQCLSSTWRWVAPS